MTPSVYIGGAPDQNCFIDIELGRQQPHDPVNARILTEFLLYVSPFYKDLHFVIFLT